MITTVFDGLRAHSPADWTVTHDAGADILRLAPDPQGGFFPNGQPRPSVVVPSEHDDALLEALAATGTPMVVVLLASKPLVLPAAANDAAALIWSANPGMEGGWAIAELLLGLIEPSGRLPISFARHVGQQPSYYNQIRGQHGDRYADLTQDPAFALGEGLSYTQVEYGGLRILENEIPADGVLRAESRCRTRETDRSARQFRPTSATV